MTTETQGQRQRNGEDPATEARETEWLVSFQLFDEDFDWYFDNRPRIDYARNSDIYTITGEHNELVVELTFKMADVKNFSLYQIAVEDEQPPVNIREWGKPVIDRKNSQEDTMQVAVITIKDAQGRQSEPYYCMAEHPDLMPSLLKAGTTNSNYRFGLYFVKMSMEDYSKIPASSEAMTFFNSL